MNDEFMQRRATIVYLREHGGFITKKKYSDWREIAEEFDDYQTSLNYTYADILDFFIEDYHIDESEQQTLMDFFKSDYTVFEWGSPDNKMY